MLSHAISSVSAQNTAFTTACFLRTHTHSRWSVTISSCNWLRVRRVRPCEHNGNNFLNCFIVTSSQLRIPRNEFVWAHLHDVRHVASRQFNCKFPCRRHLVAAYRNLAWAFAKRSLTAPGCTCAKWNWSLEAVSTVLFSECMRAPPVTAWNTWEFYILAKPVERTGCVLQKNFQCMFGSFVDANMWSLHNAVARSAYNVMGAADYVTVIMSVHDRQRHEHWRSAAFSRNCVWQRAELTFPKPFAPVSLMRNPFPAHRIASFAFWKSPNVHLLPCCCTQKMDLTSVW